MSKKKKSKKEKSSKPSLWASLSEPLKISVGALIAAIIGLAGFYLTPIKHFVYHNLYEEDAQVQVISDNHRVHQGDELDIKVLVIPKSKINVSKGTCEIRFNSDVFRFKEGEKTFNFSELDGPKYLGENFDIKLTCLKPGKTYVKVRLRTKYNTYMDSTQITILPPYKSEQPTTTDFSGLWPIKLGYNSGHMTLKDNDGNLSGSYKLENGDFGVINGLRDGSTFIVDFIRKGEIFKWHIDAEWIKNLPYIEIKGNTHELWIKNDAWKRLNTDEYKFYSTVKIE